jgi:hypothetical protein
MLAGARSAAGSLGHLSEVRVLGDEDTRQYRAMGRDGDRDLGLAGLRSMCTGWSRSRSAAWLWASVTREQHVR